MEHESFEPSGYTSISDTLIITSNNDTDLDQFSGFGSQEDPILLSQLNFLSSLPQKIIISNTTLHIKIDNNIIKSGEIGIYLESVSNVEINNNLISDFQTGIQIVDSQNIGVYFNNIHSNLDTSLLISESNQITINNNVFSNAKQGISVSGNSIVIANNHFIHNENFAIDLSVSSLDVGVFWNNFYSQNTSNQHAFDGGINNTFSTNYWDGNTEPSYSVSGSSFNIDDRIVTSPYSLNNVITFISITKHVISNDNTTLTLEWDSFEIWGSVLLYSVETSLSKNKWNEVQGNLHSNNSTVLLSDLSPGKNHIRIEGKLNDDLAVTSNDIIVDLPKSNSSTKNILIPVSISIFVLIILILSMIWKFYDTFLKKIPTRFVGNRLLKRELEPLFAGLSFVTFGIIDNLGENEEEIVKSGFPVELLQYKYLLHPIRLGIVKLLYTMISIPSYELRKELGISWGSFSPQIASLEEKGYITSVDEFIDSNPRKILSITPLGESEFRKLKLLLEQLL